MEPQYKLYDSIYKTKDYSLDIAYLQESLKKYNILGKVSSIFEIGCGTGNHTIELAKIYDEIYAIDNDEKMLLMLKEKINNLSIKNIFTDIPSNKTFKVGVSFFNVINYIPNSDLLNNFFSSINNYLTKDGIFIFDCYNSESFQEETKFTNKTLTYNNEETFEIITKTEFDKKNNFLMVTEKYQNQDQVITSNNQYKIWTKEQIFEILKTNYFEIIVCSDKQNPQRKVSNQIILTIKKIK